MVNLSPLELEKATEHFRRIRENDGSLSTLQREFAHYLYAQVNYLPINNGSFGLWLNHSTSDLDLAIGVPYTDLDNVIKKLTKISAYRAKRRSTATTYRYIFEFLIKGISIDLGVLPPHDFLLTQQGMRRCRINMSQQSRIIHVWQKQKLLDNGLLKDYAQYKLEPYRKYFDKRFIFTPIEKLS